MKLTFYNRQQKWNQETELNNNAKLFRCYHFTSFSLTRVTLIDCKYRTKELLIMYHKKYVNRCFPVISYILWTRKNEYTNWQNLSKIRPSNICEQMMVQFASDDRLKFEKTYICSYITRIFGGQCYIKWIDVKKDNCDTFSFFVCIMLAVSYKWYISFYRLLHVLLPIITSPCIWVNNFQERQNLLFSLTNLS